MRRGSCPSRRRSLWTISYARSQLLTNETVSQQQGCSATCLRAYAILWSALLEPSMQENLQRARWDFHMLYCAHRMQLRSF